jgi:Ser/Thr protein kinase RdoA (MazF antagonist)
MNDTALAVPPPALLGRWGLEARRLILLEAKANTHWKIEGTGDDFILRRYRAGQTARSIDYEFAVLRHLQRKGWPVATPVGGVVWHDDAAFALFPCLPGQALRHGDPARRRQRGRILAHIHRDLRDVELGQREGWLRVDEVVRGESAEELCARPLSSRAAGLAALVSSHCARVRERFDAAGITRLPCGIVHGDFIGQNLLFGDDTLTGLLDFDSTHFDLRAADVACARRRADDDVVRGYLEVSALEDIERQCLDDLWRATVLRYAFQLGDGVVHPSMLERELQWCVRQLEKTVAFVG